MKIIRVAIVSLLLAALSPFVAAQATKQGAITAINSTPTASCSANSCVCVSTQGIGTVTVQTTGTYTASGGLSGLVTVDGLTFKTLGGSSVFKRKSTGVSTGTITSGEQDVYDVTGATGTNFCVSALGAVTGTATVSINTSPASSGGGSSGGGGTSDATAANQATQITAEQAIQASVASIDTKTPASPATAGNQTTQISHESRLTSSAGPKAPGAALATTAFMVGGTYNSGGVTLTNTQEAGVQLTSSGALQTNDAAVLAKFTTTAASDSNRVPVTAPDGAQVSGTLSAAIPTATVTISTASPGVITWTSHGRSVNEPIVLSTGGTMAAPFVAGNTYYVASVIDANSFTLSSTPGGTAINTSSSGTGTQTATASVLFYTLMDGYGGLSMAFGPSGNMNVIFEQSEDYSYWYSTMVQDTSSTSTTLNLITTISGSTSTTKYWSKKAKLFRIRVTAYTSGTTTVTATKLSGSPGGITATFSGNQNVVGPTGDSGTSTFNPLQIACNTNTANRTALATGKVAWVVCDTLGHVVNRPWSIPEAETPYAAGSGGVSNSTADQTLASAPAAGIRNYLTGIDLMCEALGTASEITIRDGSGGTVLWRTKVGTGGQPLVGINFPNPKKTTAATALIWKMETASGTGACFLNGNTFQAP